MVAKKRDNQGLRRDVAELYDWIDQQLRSQGDSAGRCETCGRCCDFEAYDHRLFVTGPELLYLAANLDVEILRPMPTGRCPYHLDGRCTVYASRFAGCRIFCCTGEADFQSRLTEAVLNRLKSIGLKYNIPYCYTDLACALNRPASL